MQAKTGRTGLLLFLPSLAGVCAFYVLPFLSSLYYTFTQGVSEPRFVGLANFRDLLDSPVFRHAVGNTALFLILGVPLALACALLLSVALAAAGLAVLLVNKRRHPRGREALFVTRQEALRAAEAAPPAEAASPATESAEEQSEEA